MCGIAGQFNPSGSAEPLDESTSRALAMIRHRGPDQFGIYADEFVGLGNARLSIVDLAHGQQPITNEDESLWIVYNGEVFNHPELRAELEGGGHRFSTHTDTEVILHLYEDLGPACLSRLNGQFAIAIWDRRRRRLFLARDRLGVRPLFYATVADRLFFGSEIKSLLVHPEVRAELDVVALDQIFTYWSPLSPRTAFRNIQELPPGHFLEADDRGIRVNRYWEVAFPEGGSDVAGENQSIEDVVEKFRELLVDAARIRLRADVPVGAYLSGGLDSSAIASIVRHHTSAKLQTFSIAFADTEFDESVHQLKMADYLGTEHHVVHATHADIGAVFPEVIWHTEIPLTRTSPAPMFLLSKLVRDHGLKVVLTGEGADEFLAGYDIFKEARIRRFWARRPDSKWRSLLLQRLYPEISGLGRSNAAFLAAFFKNGLSEVDSPDYSHAVRWRNTRRATRFFSAEVADQLGRAGSAGSPALRLPETFQRWGPLERAQFLEIDIFLSQYLLSSQGDRVAMAHSVEGRFPFLDYRVVEFCNALPTRFKLRGLTEKHLLRRAAEAWLPKEVSERRKRPYRAPIHKGFFNRSTPDYVRELLSEDGLRKSGLFNPKAVSALVSKIELGGTIGETDDMGLVGIISTQLWWSLFTDGFRAKPELSERDDVKRCLRSTARFGRL